MTDLWGDLLACLDLLELPPAGFEGRNQQLSYHRLFGGQLLAQFVRAASLTSPGKTVKSLHVLFPREGRSQEPVRYEVERHHEGSTFAALTIRARQAPGVIATASVSLHAPEDGLSQQVLPGLPAIPGAEHRVELGLLPWETRSTTDLDSPGSGPPVLELWMRIPPVSPALAPAVTAYATDLTLIGTALRPVEGVSQRDAGTAFISAVTSHTIWFPPAVPNGRVAAAAPAQPAAGPRPLLRPGRRPGRRRLPGGLLRPGGPAPVPAVTPRVLTPPATAPGWRTSMPWAPMRRSFLKGNYPRG